MYFLFPNLTDKIPIGIATKKQIKLNIAKQIEEKFVPAATAPSKEALTASETFDKSGTPYTVWIAYCVK